MNNTLKPDASGVRETKGTKVKPMGKKASANRTLNKLNLLMSMLVFGTGLILLFEFHMGDGAHRKEWIGIGKEIWLAVHQGSAIGFLVGFAAHIQMHWKYIRTVARQWRVNLPQRTKATTREQILLLIVTLTVMWAAFYPWIAMPGATLEVKTFHYWIDVHSRVGLFFLIGMGVHIKRRWQRIFASRGGATRRNARARREPADRRRKRIMNANAMRSRRNSTKYVFADTGKCKACWACIDECEHDVLGKINLWFHKHVVIKNAEKCLGCKRCIDVCPNGVFEPLMQTRIAVNQY